MSAPESCPPAVAVSVAIPVYNEEANLPVLLPRLLAALDGLGRSYEIVFANDGSRDGSLAVLRTYHAARPDVVRIVDLDGNHGQHLALLAAFERVRGEVIVTLDADLQNPPEEIPRLLAAIEAGHDCVGGVRVHRRDSWFRRTASWLVNRLRERTTRIRMTDQGCMLRAYRRSVVEAIVASGALYTFIPALAWTLASRPTEISVGHAERHAGSSNYSLARLFRLNFDLITAFSLAPLQALTLLGLASTAGSFLLLLFLLGRRLVLGPAEGWLFVLVGLLLCLVSLVLAGIGLVGEYAGRTYQVVRTRQRWRVRAVWDGAGSDLGTRARS